MNIDRHNYELFFLLYVDNELSAQEKNAIKLFIKENPDLQEELDMLQQSIVQPDEIIFKDKSSLLKKESISAATEEQLLMYLDNELGATHKKELELLLANDKSLAAELKVLQQTKLSPADTIVFVDKQLLYRKERNRVIPFGWWRIAAAAAFIGFGILGTAIYLNRDSKVVVNQTAYNRKVKPNDVVNDTTATIQQEVKVPSTEVIAATTPQPIPVQTVIKKTVQSPVRIKQQEPALQENNTLATLQKINDKPNNNLPKPYFDNLNNSSSNKNSVTNVTLQTQNNTISNIAITTKEKKAQPAEPNNNIYTTVFTDNSNDNKEDRYTFSDDEPKKSKLSGFLRKAKRVLERNTKMKSGDDNVKVANLEFAIQ
jgi:anti-sigma factor RsiW